MNKKLITISIITYLLVIFVGIYFKFFPTIINSKITNIALVGSIFLLIALFLYGIFLIRSSEDLYFILPQILIFIFFARAVPNLRLPYMPLHDAYYYLVTTLNVIKHGTLQPIMEGWYYLISMQLHYPVLHILTAGLTKMTGIDVMVFARFLNPALSLLFFLGVYLLTKELTKNIRLSLLAALFASLIDGLIFYQSEFHPQGLAFAFFIFMIYAFVKFNKSHKFIHFFSFGIFMILLMLTHHFTSLFIALVFLLYLLFLFAYNFAFRKDATISTFITKYKTNILMIGCYLTLVLAYNLIYQEAIKSFYIIIINSLNSFLIPIIIIILFFVFLISSRILIKNKNLLKNLLTNQLVIAAVSIIIIVTGFIAYLFFYRDIGGLHFLGAYKIFLFGLALIYIIKYGLNKEDNLNDIMLLFLSIIIIGIAGFFLIKGFPLDRIIVFSAPFACIFTLMLLFNLSDKKDININQITVNKKLFLVILIISILITLSFFNSQMPAFFFKDSKLDTSYWYSNQLPSMEEHKAAGEWLYRNTPSEAKFNVNFDTIIIPFFYGEKPKSNLRYNVLEDSDYIIASNFSNTNDIKLGKEPINKNLDKVYNNEKFQVYKLEE